MATRKKTESLIMCQGHGSEYLKCSGMQLESNFCKSNSPFNSGRVIYCKDCLNKIYEYYLSQSNSNMQTALFYTLQKVDVPFITELFVRLQEEIKKRNKSGQRLQSVVSIYIGYVNINKAKEKIWTDFSATDVDLSDIDSRIEGREIKKKELEEFTLDWGVQSEEDYVFLEYRFDVYTKDSNLTPTQETLYRQLCLVELAKRRKEIKGDSTKEEQDMMIKLMDKLKISNFEEKKDKTEFDLLMERQIWEVENTEPCEEIDIEMYKDICNINSQWGNEIKRAVQNLIAGTKEYPTIEKIKELKQKMTDSFKKNKE